MFNTFTARQKTLTHRQHVLSCRFNYFAQYTCTIVHSPCDILHQATHGFQTKKKVSESDHPVKSSFSLGVYGREPYTTLSRAITCACTTLHSAYHMLDQLIPRIPKQAREEETELRKPRYAKNLVTCKWMGKSGWVFSLFPCYAKGSEWEARPLRADA